MKNKTFNRTKHIKSISRALLHVKPTRILKNKKEKIKIKEAEKEIMEYK